MRILTPNDYRKMPWKNGGGVTYEIALSHPEGRYAWRLSRADVETSGPFSEFSGYMRWLTVVDGNGLLLNQKRLCAPEMIHFDGSAKIHCELIAGPVKDLGLIYDPSLVQAEMRVIKDERIVLSDSLHYIFAQTEMILSHPVGRVIPASHTLTVHGPTQLESISGEGIHVSIRSVEK